MAKSKKPNVPTETEKSKINMGIDHAHSLLTQDEKDAILLRARDRILEEQKQQAEDMLFEKALKSERERIARENGNPDDYEDIEVHIDLPEHAANVYLDQVIYWHGYSYHMPRIKAAAVEDIMARAWEHDADRRGEKWRVQNPAKSRGINVSKGGARVGS